MTETEELNNLKYQLAKTILMSTCLHLQLDNLLSCRVNGKPFAKHRLKNRIRGLQKEMETAIDAQNSFYDKETVGITGVNVDVIEQYANIFAEGDTVKINTILELANDL